jgi:hypothetical protein
MNKSMITLVAALGLGLGGCATTTYNGMIYEDGSYYSPPADGNGDYYVAPEPQPYYGDPFFYGPYGDPFWYPPFASGWGGHPCSALYRFCPLWASRWYDPWYDPWYSYGSGFSIGLTFGDGGWYGGNSGWYGGWYGGGHHGRGRHDGHDGRGGHDGRDGHGRPPHRGDRPPTSPAADDVAWTDPRVDAGAAAGEPALAEDAIGGAHGRPLPRGRWYRVAPGTPEQQSGMPNPWARRVAPADGRRVDGGTPRSGGSSGGSPRSEASRGSGRSDQGGSRSERRSEARSSDDDGGGQRGRRVRGGSDDD